MYNLKNVILYEIDKITGQKKYIKNVIIQIVLLVVLVVVFYFLEKKLHISTNFSGFNYFLSSVNITSVALKIFSTTILPFYIFTLGTDLFASEISDNTIKNILLRPVDRLTIYVGKIMAILIYIAFSLITIYFTCLILKLIFGMGFKGELIKGLEYIITIIPLAVVVAYSCFISTATSSTSASMFILIITYIGFFILSLLSSKFSTLNFLNYMNYYDILLSRNLPIRIILNTTLLLLSTGSIFFIIGFLIFDNKDI